MIEWLADDLNLISTELSGDTVEYQQQYVDMIYNSLNNVNEAYSEIENKLTKDVENVAGKTNN